MGRQQIIAAIRSSLNRKGPLAGGVEQALEQRLRAPTTHVQPLVDGSVLEAFLSKVERVSATTAHISSEIRISDAVRDYLETHELTGEIVVAEDELLSGVNWSNTLSVKRGLPADEDEVSVTTAFAAVAETGSVVMLSAPESPTTLNFLPAHHLVVVRTSSIVRHTEDVWAKLRLSPAEMPRTVNFITGPSRTGDVEQVLQLGAHGPRELHVIVLDA
jgi:L-lactate dehydrogenase complex protein LldG